MERTEIREDLDNTVGWSRIESTFETNAGIDSLIRRLTIFDNGMTKEERFGVSVSSTTFLECS